MWNFPVLSDDYEKDSANLSPIGNPIFFNDPGDSVFFLVFLAPDARGPSQDKVYMDPRHKVSKPGGYKNWQRTTKLTLLPFLLTVTVQTEASNRSGVFPNENLSFSHREAVKQNDTG